MLAIYLDVLSIEYILAIYYNRITVKGERPQRKGVALMRFQEWLKLTNEQKQKAFEEYKKRVTTCSNK